MTMKLGLLHPGEMGISIAAAALENLPQVFWCSEGRSGATRQRAERHALTEISTLAEFCATCDLIIGVCPPHAAQTQAKALITHNFKGTYVEANAIAPAKVQQIAAELAGAGILCIDGGIIGLPAWNANSTWLYLSGDRLQTVAQCFSNGFLQVKTLGSEIGQASALKMCFAAWNKGNTALLAAILGSAETYGVRTELEQQWDIFTPGFTRKTHTRITETARKAWRFAGEMEEIAATLQQSGMPEDFFLGAAEVYRRLASFKDIADAPAIGEILEVICGATKTKD
jgi:3-hydroxyisobutyrate dehydrogenase-like beta-hydroxyacid dehydrogenase